MRGFDTYLTFQKLEVFCCVAELRSVTRAAERLCIAQPVVTAHLRGMEARLGYPLVQRAGRNIALTEGGERVYRWASEVISRTREMERELAGMAQGHRGAATIGASMSLGSYALPPLVADFHAAHPEGVVTVQISNPLAAVDAVRIGDCDFAVIMLAPGQDLAGLSAHALWEDPLLLVSAPQSRWTGPRADPAQLREVPFISAPRNMARREIEDAQLRAHQLGDRRVVLEFGHPEAMKHAVRQDLGLCFLPACCVADDVARGALRVVELPGVATRISAYLVHRDAKRFSAFQQALVDHIRTAAQTRHPP